MHARESALMLNRRQVLAGMSVAALGSAASASPLNVFITPSFTQHPGVAAEIQPQEAVDKAIEDRLRSDLTQLDSRANSEEGVPVFLGCVNLVTPQAQRVVLSALNTTLVADFRKNAAAWERIRPKSTANDVGILIEVLAARDFDIGGKEAKS
jgi:hypothetical protein